MNGFTTYREYFDLVTLLPKKEQGDLVLAIWNYMFLDEEPTLNENQMKIFRNLKRPLDKSKKRSSSGSITNSNNNQEENEKETKQNQNEIKNKSNKNQNKNKITTHQDVNVIVNKYNNTNNLEDRGLRGKKPLNEFNAFEFYENNFGTLSSFISEKLVSFENEYGSFKLQKALEESILKGAKNLSYVEAILNNWKDKTWNEILKEQDKIKKSKNSKSKSPEWFDKKIEKEQITDEERKELEEMMKDFRSDDNVK